jgi:lysophospholipase L1-like esterase
VKLLLVLFALALSAPAARAEAFELKDGDRVVWLGSTLIEREQRYGWWELALTTRFPDRKVTFRNLGWSGDTVFGDSHTGYAYTRTGNANVAGGFKHLIEHTLSLKPTVLIIGYGTNESFAGEKGLEKFVKGLNTLLDALEKSKARVVLLSPMQQGKMGKPLPDPTKHNKDLCLYADAIKEVSKKRKATFVDLYALLGDPAKEKGATENGIHLTDHGYRWAAEGLMKGLGHGERWSIRLDVDAKKVLDARGAKAEWLPKAKKAALLVKVTEGLYFLGERKLALDGLPKGKGARVWADDGGLLTSAEEWGKGHELPLDGKIARAAAARLGKLRQAIVDKNELYFHRWRPQNETYLFGFRKSEQGKNAVEIPKFDPLIEKKEKEIAALNEPYDYELAIEFEEIKKK